MDENTTNTIISKNTRPKSHQKYVIDKLVAIHPDQHGMLVAHKMGGGKTLTALMFLNNYPNHSRIIVAPKQLLALWEQDSLKHMGRPLDSNIEVISYRDFVIKLEDDLHYLSGKVCVFDEAQYLEEAVVKYTSDYEKYVKIKKFLKKDPYRVLLLTGTPIRIGIYDIVYYINMAAGSDIINIRTFFKEFGIPSKIGMVLYGYLTPIVNQVPQMISSLRYKISSFFTIGSIGFLLKYFSKKTKHDPVQQILNTYKLDKLTQAGSNVMQRLDYLESLQPSILATRYAKTKFSLEDDDVQAIRILINLSSIFGIFSFIMSVAQNNLKWNPSQLFNQFDYKKLNTVIQPYVSFFTLIPGSKGVPFHTEINEFIPYSKNQFNIWTKFIYDDLQDPEILDLIGPFANVYPEEEDEDDNVDEDDDDAYIGKIFVDSRVYLKYGRIISNIETRDTFPEKFYVMFQNIRKHLSNPNNNHRYVIHTEFYQTVTLLKKFLTQQQKEVAFTFEHIDIKFSSKKILNILKKYEEGEVNIIVLDPQLYEGISILKTAQMHILDPPEEYGSYAQLKGRVIRMESHIDLPKNQQHVTYFNYVGVLPKDAFSEFNTIQKIKRFMSIVKKTITFDMQYWLDFFRYWIKTETYKDEIFLNYHPTISESSTAEYIRFKSLYLMGKESAKLDSIFSKLDTSISQDELKCCPLYVSDHPSKSCLEKLPPCR